MVENTHEAIVRREDYNRVQDFIKMRHRPKRHHFDNIFKDLAFCSECGNRMTFMMKERITGMHGLIRCMHRYKNSTECQHFHYIYYEDLYDEVQKRIRKIAKGIESGELLTSIRKHATKQGKTDKLEVEIAKINNRLGILAKIIKKLYEDFASDLLDTENYHKMLRDYTQEQKQLSQRIRLMQGELNKKDEYTDGLQKLGEVLQAYLNIDVLTANMLNQLIERIEIGHPVTVNGTKQQEINIIYRFIGTTL